MEEKETIVIDVQLDANGVANQLAQVNEQIAAVKAQNAALRKEVKDGTKTWADVSGQLAVNEQRLKTLTTTQKALTAQFNAQVGTNLRLGDSLKEMGAELTALKNAYRSLSKAERESDAGKELLKRIQELDAEMKAADASMGDFQRNVGNYPGAVQPLIDKLDDLTQQMDALQAAGQADSDEFKELNKQASEVKAQMQQLQQSVDGIGQEMAPLKQQIKDATNELLQMKLRGEENTEQYQQMLEHLGKLKDTMMDAQAEIKQMASDTGALNSVLDGVKAAAGGFSVALGVMTLVGDKDSETAKELAEAQAKLQSAIAITTGLQAVQNALQKESAFMMGVNKIRILAAAAAQKLYAAATRDAEAAQVVFNKVAKSNIYVWLAGIILTVVGAIAAFTRGSKEQEEQTKAVNSELKSQLEYLRQLDEMYSALGERAIKDAQFQLDRAKATGKSTKEIRELEDALFNARLSNLEKLEKELGYSRRDHNRLQWEYEHQLQEYEDGVRRMAENAGKVPEIVTQMSQAALDEQKKHLDETKGILDQFDKLYEERKNLQNEQAEREAQRRREDEEASKRAAEEAAKRWRENAQAIREANKALIEVATADELYKKGEENNAKLAQSFQDVADRVGLFADELKDLPAPKDIPFISDEGLTDSTSQLELFAESYKENAQAIQETSSALESSFSSMASMYQQMAQDETRSEEERAKAARKAKAWSKIQIATNAGAAVAKGVATAVDVGFPAAIPAIATMTATILSAIAQAKSLLSEAYESGGVIGGYHGVSMGHDNTAIIARRGEMVLNANQQRQLFEIANGGSKAGGMYSALADALRSMPAPVLVYSEFQDFTNKVATLDEAAKLR